MTIILSMVVSCLFFTMSACSSSKQNLADIDTANLSQLESVQAEAKSPSTKRKELSQMRMKILKDTAMSLGAQGGLAWASEQINVQLNQDRKYLDSIYNFYAMVLSHGVMPPVLEESTNNLNLTDANTIRVSDKTYKIVQQARFATTPPNWREYLWLTYTKPQLPDRTLLPRTTEEHKIWKEGVRLGWEKGIQQSYTIFQQGLARLKRDYRGMLIYRKLLQEKMISPPFVARTELGITGDGEDMRVNDQVLRIVDHPKLQTNSKNWQAILVPRHD